MLIKGNLHSTQIQKKIDHVICINKVRSSIHVLQAAEIKFKHKQLIDSKLFYIKNIPRMDVTRIYNHKVHKDGY